MKLKPVIKKQPPKKVETPKQEPAKRKKQENTLPPDEYKPMFPPQRILVREIISGKDSHKATRQYLELSVKRFGEDEVNEPMAYIQMYQESDFYTGYLKGKSVHIPLNAVYDLIDGLTELSEECEKRNIE